MTILQAIKEATEIVGNEADWTLHPNIEEILALLAEIARLRAEIELAKLTPSNAELLRLAEQNPAPQD